MVRLALALALMSAAPAGAAVIECELTRACHADMDCVDVGPLPLAVTEQDGAFAFATADGIVAAEPVSPADGPQRTLMGTAEDRVVLLTLWPGGAVALTGHGTAAGRPDTTTLFGTCLQAGPA